MDIIIEIGTSEQQTQIREELAVFPEAAKHGNPPLNISKVVIASNFDAKVNELQGTNTYKSDRGVTAVAKIVNMGDSFAVVLSPNLYTEDNDTQTRLFIFLHEIMHISNKSKFPTTSSASYSTQTYLGNIYTLFDEYAADRAAFEIVDDVFHEKSDRWKAFIQNDAVGFSSLINDAKHYVTIRSEIKSFRIHADLTLFLKNTYPVFDNVALSIAHAFSLADHDPLAVSLNQLTQSPFVNDKTLALIRFFKGKYQERVFDLDDGIDLIREFMTNFGIRFEDKPQGGYCHVLDI